MYKYLKFFDEVRIGDIPQVGGKNASLGEMYHFLAPQGVHLPNGVATTADAYRYFFKTSGLNDKISAVLDGLNIADVDDLAKRGARIRSLITHAKFPKDFEDEIVKGYLELSARCGNPRGIICAVRSSATAEDLPNASFAGQQETYLNVKGAKNILKATKDCIASLFTDRAIVYRVENGFDHMKVALSVGIQQMVAVRAKSAGVMFTIDTESGFKNAVIVSSIYGLGENIVQGHVSPDEFTVFKPTMAIIRRKLGSKSMRMVPMPGNKTKNLKVSDAMRPRFSITDEQVKTLADWGMKIEQHYGHPMDMEWALDEADNQLYIVQARGETVASHMNTNKIEEYKLLQSAPVIARGTSVGSRIGAGRAHRILSTADIDDFKAGEVLITEMTDPDWVPIMKIASAIVTDKGGRTSHAAIVSRELGIPCVVGTGNGTSLIKTGDPVTVSCAEGDDGMVYQGILKYEINKTDVTHLPKTKTKMEMIVGSPDEAFAHSLIPNDGCGLAREEFIVTNHIKIHPLALIHFNQVRDPAVRAQINDITLGYKDKTQYFVDKLAEGVAMIGAAFYPKDVILRFSDFKTNEYAKLIGGSQFEPKEENPMLGWRGASRYYSPAYREGFELECKAIKRVREEMGLTNVKVMVPFCRNIDEAKMVQKIMAGAGLKRGVNGLQVYVMVEIPSNVILAEQFAELFDGFSIGSNDLTQLTLGVDRDNHTVSNIYNENNPAVKAMVAHAIEVAHKTHTAIGLCGQAPSDYPEFARFLVEQGIDAMALQPDVLVKTTINVAKTEQKLGR
ncbi:MAG: phosphoenolpyruvate synthase [Candidatus Nomurabacteria bacterium]|jgi:pyruvate,water dikinase|nr:phosphoenolpyruvate synthase [Candidatus Nomurabacteria bacterium]